MDWLGVLDPMIQDIQSMDFDLQTCAFQLACNCPLEEQIEILKHSERFLQVI